MKLIPSKSAIGQASARPLAANRHCAAGDCTSRSRVAAASIAAPVTALALLLSACAGGTIQGGGAVQMYDLAVSQPAVTSQRTTPKNVQLVVYEPATIRTHDSDRVVVRLANSQVNYLDGARWSDRLPALLQDSLIEILMKSQQFRAVSNGRDKVDADVSLSSTIQTFEVDLGGGSKSARISLAAKLVDERTGGVLDTRLFTGSAPLRANQPADHVAAIKDAFTTVAADLVRWSGEVKIKPRRDKLPDAIARGSIQPAPDTDRDTDLGDARLSGNARAATRNPL